MLDALRPVVRVLPDRVVLPSVVGNMVERTDDCDANTEVTTVLGTAVLVLCPSVSIAIPVVPSDEGTPLED